MHRLWELLTRRGTQSRDHRYEPAEHTLDTTDAFAAARSRDVDPLDWGAEGGGLPPNYVKSYDEGRPRK
jgi:hypothetical protein